eukprot:852443_1
MASTSAKCTTSSPTPLWVSLIFGSFSFMALICTTIMSIRHLKTSMKHDWIEASFCTKIKLCARDVWGRKSVYLPLVSHLADTVTDFASVVEFGIVAATSNDCGVDVWKLFILSIGCMVLYRAVSAYKMYQITGSWRRTSLQALDMELYHILYFSHKWNLKNSSSPQRMLAVLESTLEAAPQAVIQMVYLLFTGNMSGVVVASTVFSFINLTSAIVSDDVKMCGLRFPSSCQAVVSEDGRQFISLYVFRVLDVPSKLLFYAFAWYLVHDYGGYVCFGILLLDAMIAFGVYLKTSNTDALLAFVVVPLTFGSGDYKDWVKRYWYWCMFQLISVNTLIWILIRNDLFGEEDEFVVVLWFYCSIASVCKWLFAFRIIGDVSHASKERSDLNALIATKSYADALELILFKDTDTAATKRYGEDQHTLLALARLQNDKHWFNTIAQHGLDNKVTDDTRHWTELLEALKSSNSHAIQCILSSPQIDYAYLMVVDTEGRTAVYWAISEGTLEQLRWFIDCLNMVLKSEDDGETKRVTLLRNAWAKREQKWTVFHWAASLGKSAEWFQALCDAYGSQSEAKRADISSAATILYGDDKNTMLTMAMRSNDERWLNTVAQHGLANKVTDKERYSTALMVACGASKDHAIQSILSSPQIDIDYLMVADTDGVRAVYCAIRYGTLDRLMWFMECLNRVSNTGDDAEATRANVLNNAEPGDKRTVFHMAARWNKSLDWFKVLYDGYGSESKAKEAIAMKDYKDITVLDVLKEMDYDTKE